jgi:hypothetical protein
MKAALIKKAEGWYNLYQDKIGIGSTYPELQGYKLSKQNCDEIFGIVDVEKLADELYNGHAMAVDWQLEKSGFKTGFNKAMELNKDKQFTIEDMKRAFIAGSNFTSPDEVVLNETFGQSMNRLIKSLQQPTEIEVEIEMEEYGYCEGCRRAGMWHCAHADTCGNAETRERPKLDADGCLILKKL